DCASRQAIACSRPPLPITNKSTPMSRVRLKPSVPEMAYASEYHGDTILVCGGDDLVVAHAATRLNHRTRAGVDHHIQPIAKGEESIRSHCRVNQCQASVLRFDGSDARRIHAAHLSRPNADGHAVATEHD